MSLFAKDYQECPFCDKKLPKGTIVSDVSASQCRICGKTNLQQARKEVLEVEWFKGKLIWIGIGLFLIYSFFFTPSSKKSPAVESSSNQEQAEKLPNSNRGNFSENEPTKNEGKNESAESKAESAYPILEISVADYIGMWAVEATKRQLLAEEFERYDRTQLSEIYLDILVRHGLKREDRKNRYIRQGELSLMKGWYDKYKHKLTKTPAEVFSSMPSLTKENANLIFSLAQDTLRPRSHGGE
jgi:hypothetical protein